MPQHITAFYEPAYKPYPYPVPPPNVAAPVKHSYAAELEAELAKQSHPSSEFCSCFCCPCCPCMPSWMRCVCCIGFLLLLAISVTAGVLAAMFKMPKVELNRVVDHPAGLERFQQQSTTQMAFEINVGLDIGVVNPNIESAAFEKLKATAYYPTNPRQPVGGGELTNIVIGAQATTNFTFPFQIKYDQSKDQDQRMLLDLSQKCGLTGAAKKDIAINYSLTQTISILGFPFSFTINNAARFPCPIDEGWLQENNGTLPKKS